MCIWILISWNFGWFGRIWRCKNLSTELYRFILNGTGMHDQSPYRFSINLHRRTSWRQVMSSVLSDQRDEAPVAGNTHQHESQHIDQKDSQQGITARPLKREFRSWYVCANFEDNLTMWISSNLNENCRMNLASHLMRFNLKTDLTAQIRIKLKKRYVLILAQIQRPRLSPIY
jgi:hypothetical protein